MENKLRIGKSNKQCQNYTKKQLLEYIHRNTHNREVTMKRTKKELCLMIALDTQRKHAKQAAAAAAPAPQTLNTVRVERPHDPDSVDAFLDNLLDQHKSHVSVESRHSPTALRLATRLWFRVFDRELHLVPIRVLESMMTNETDAATVERYARSIRAGGLREPLTVAFIRNTPNMLLAEGHHRLCAMKQLGLRVAPVEIIYLKMTPVVSLKQGIVKKTNLVYVAIPHTLS